MHLKFIHILFILTLTQSCVKTNSSTSLPVPSGLQKIPSACVNSVQSSVNVGKSRALGSCLFVIENLGFLNGYHTNLKTTCISTWYKYHLLSGTLLVWVHLVLKSISYQ